MGLLLIFCLSARASREEETEWRVELEMKGRRRKGKKGEVGGGGGGRLRRNGRGGMEV